MGVYEMKGQLRKLGSSQLVLSAEHSRLRGPDRYGNIWKEAIRNPHGWPQLWPLTTATLWS